MTNEKRLIDANALVEGLKLHGAVVTGARQDEVRVTIHRIKESPTVDAVEVVHGEWVWKDLHGDGSFSLCCSVCLGTDGARETAHYCSDCGAKMDGGADRGKT